MKKAEISSSMLVFIIIAIVAMTLFIIFFTGAGAGLFKQFGRIEPETADDACQIACNQAKINKNCVWWCGRIYGDGPSKCYEHNIDCDFKDAKGKECSCTK